MNNYSLDPREHCGRLFLLDMSFIPQLKVYVRVYHASRKHRMTAGGEASASLPAANTSMNHAVSSM